MELKDLRILIFDVDGVLVYVGDSYRKAIAKTVQYYLSDLTGLESRDYLITGKDTQDFKLAGGFNDDWDVTYAAILCYLTKLISEVGNLAGLQTGNAKTFSDMIKTLKKIGAMAGGIDLKLDLTKITSKIKENGGGIDGTERTLEQMFGKNEEIAKNFVFYDLIKRVFEEFYLGEEFFRGKYGEKPIFIHTSGFIRNEKALISEKTLEKLSSKYGFGISTGRERFEAEKTIEIQKFGRFFPREVIVARGDTEIGKPNPSSLIECKKRVCKRYKLGDDSKAAYIGDIPDDVLAARNANFYSIGCLSSVSDPTGKKRLRNEFQNLGCDLIIENADDLKNLTTR